MTHTNSNLVRTYKRKQEEYTPKDRKRIKDNDKYLRSKARAIKERERDIEGE